MVLAAGSWLADATCLWLALAAAGVQLDADVVLLAYVAGIVIASLPLLPGGIGAVEAAIPAVLHYFGAPLDAAIAGTLVYRGISFLLPLGPAPWSWPVRLCVAAVGFGNRLRNPGLTMRGLDQRLPQGVSQWWSSRVRIR